MTNLEYINTLPCSQKLKDRILSICKEKRGDYFLKLDKEDHHIDGFFSWHNTTEGHKYWEKIMDSIINNTPIKE